MMSRNIWGFLKPWANREQKYLSFFESLHQQGAEVEYYSFYSLPGPGNHQIAATAYGEPSKILSSGLERKKKTTMNSNSWLGVMY